MSADELVRTAGTARRRVGAARRRAGAARRRVGAGVLEQAEQTVELGGVRLEAARLSSFQYGAQSGQRHRGGQGWQRSSIKVGAQLRGELTHQLEHLDRRSQRTTAP